MSEVCSNCGEFVEELDSYTGWCETCSPGNGKATYIRIETWLKVNADELEHYISEGVSFRQAVKSLANDRPKCIVCGGSIAHAARSSIFCRKTPQCRRYSRRYVYLYREANPRLTKVEALATIFSELS
jgi:hypothetical protein